MTPTYYIKTACTAIVNLVFPPQCLLCRNTPDSQSGSFLCSECLSRINFIRTPICTTCGTPFPSLSSSNHLCGMCLSSQPPFSVARSMGFYSGTLLDAANRLKYQNDIMIGEKMATLMAAHIYDSFSISDYSVIIPVPLHPIKLRKRGFNQSLVLARQISKIFSIPVDFLSLKKTTNTKPQVGLTKYNRKINVRNSFAINDTNTIKGKKVLLIDDVYTTGSTIRECSRTLRKHGAHDIGVLTLARTPLETDFYYE